MSTTLFTILLYFSMLFNPGVITFDHPATVEEGLVVLREMYPDWVANYKEDEFDCSEMSSLVAQYFIVAGYTDVQIKAGYNMQEGFSHEWVVVDGKIIEATGLYISRDHKFYRQMNDRGETYKLYCEKDWWNSQYMLNNGLRYYLVKGAW